MLEKFKFSWRLTVHRHPSGGLKNPSPHARPLHSLLSLLNNCVTSYMGLNNFLDDQEDGYENVWDCLDFPPKPEYESGQGVAPALTFLILLLSFSRMLTAFYLAKDYRSSVMSKPWLCPQLCFRHSHGLP